MSKYKDTDWGYPNFHAAAERWRQAGWQVINPAEEFDGRTDLPYELYMGAAIRNMGDPDLTAIALLPDWEESNGARMELFLAQQRNLEVFDANTMGRALVPQITLELHEWDGVYQPRHKHAQAPSRTPVGDAAERQFVQGMVEKTKRDVERAYFGKSVLEQTLDDRGITLEGLGLKAFGAPDPVVEKMVRDDLNAITPLVQILGDGPRPTLPTDSAERKRIPLFTGLIDYFPAACAEVARLSLDGNDKHNPGEPLHWARGKSMDHADTIGRHMIERGTRDADGHYHDTKVAWRALAQLQELLEEREGAPLPRGARLPQEAK